MKRKVKWFSLNGKHYYTVAQCEEHGFYKGKIRIRKSVHDEIYVVKTIKWIPEEEVDAIMEKKKQIKVIRKEKKKTPAF